MGNFSSITEMDSASVPVSHDVERFVSLSGVAPDGRPKARVRLRFYEKYSNGLERDILDPLDMTKPIVKIFKHAGFASIFLDFGKQTDAELLSLWNILIEYKRPANQVSYLPEEVDAGYYETPDGKEMVFFPILELSFVSANSAAEDVVYAYNPLFFKLSPQDPYGEPCVLQLVFLEESLVVSSESDPVGSVLMQYEMAEALMSKNPISWGPEVLDISGPSADGRPKAHVLLHVYDKFHDGTEKEIHQPMMVIKPFVHIFKDDEPGYINVALDFGHHNDMDLRVIWDFLMEYADPTNSVSYTAEELDSGAYETPEGKKMVYYPVLDLALSPVGREESYMIRGLNPAFFTLAPGNGIREVCVLQFTFPEESFFVVKDLDRVDHELIHSETKAELEAEARHYSVSRKA